MLRLWTIRRHIIDAILGNRVCYFCMARSMEFVKYGAISLHKVFECNSCGRVISAPHGWEYVKLLLRSKGK